MQIGKEYLCSENQCNDLTGDRIDLSPPNPSGVSGPVDPERQEFKPDVFVQISYWPDIPYGPSHNGLAKFLP